jgi:hypothetical protein
MLSTGIITRSRATHPNQWEAFSNKRHAREDPQLSPKFRACIDILTNNLPGIGPESIYEAVYSPEYVNFVVLRDGKLKRKYFHHHLDTVMGCICCKPHHEMKFVDLQDVKKFHSFLKIIIF